MRATIMYAAGDVRVENGRVRVLDAHGKPPSIPFWLGEAPGRTHELSASVSRLRTEITDRFASDDNTAAAGSALAWLTDEVGLSSAAAEQIVEYLLGAKIALGVMPSQDTLVIERFFDESGSQQMVIHSPFGSRVNRAWGLALRKRFRQRIARSLMSLATASRRAPLLLRADTRLSVPRPRMKALLHRSTTREPSPRRRNYSHL